MVSTSNEKLPCDLYQYSCLKYIAYDMYCLCNGD